MEALEVDMECDASVVKRRIKNVGIGLDSKGTRGMDELSTVGKTYIADLKEDGNIEEYILGPGDLGTRSANEDDLLCRLDKSREALLLLRLLSGQDKGSRRDICAGQNRTDPGDHRSCGRHM